MKKLFYLFVLLAFFGQAYGTAMPVNDSADRGIRFEEGLSWQQVLAKAKAENKFIFLDCYTTWCGPCKEMERDVYPQKKVGDIFNAKFISVKIQMDSSKADNQVIRASYPDARYIENHYRISAYPTLLFFLPDGRILDQTAGLRDADGLVRLAGLVTDPRNNYYRLVEEYRNGKKMDMTEFRNLAWNGMRLGDTAQSQKLANNYILSLTNAERFKKENIEFMHDFTKNSKDPAFDFFYRNADSIDKTEGNDVFAQYLVASIIYREMVLPSLDRIRDSVEAQIDWEKFGNMIRKKYNQFYAEMAVAGSKVSWAIKRKDWKEYSTYFIECEQKFGQKKARDDYDQILNNRAWAIFTNSNDSNELNIALSWSGQAVLLNPGANWIDTYANILYKLQRTGQAMLWEEVAVKLAPGDKEFEENYKKMRSGQPTWPVR